MAIAFEDQRALHSQDRVPSPLNDEVPLPEDGDLCVTVANVAQEIGAVVSAAMFDEYGRLVMLDGALS